MGTRAAGMGGAFVAVADDASAVYWNPAGFASGSYFSLVLDRTYAKVERTSAKVERTSAKVEPGDSVASGRRSGLLMAIGFPALGLSYYRLRDSTVVAGELPTGPAARLKRAIGTDAAGRNLTGTGAVRLDTLITHHTGATLVQTIVPGLDVGATFKLVRGVASSVGNPFGTDEAQRIDRGEDFVGPGEDFAGKASNKFDVDLGVMGSLGRFKAGLTLRNMTAPEFETAGDGLSALKLERQARGGIAIVPVTGWLVAADLDLTKTVGFLGDERIFALGAEGRVAARATVRGGFRVNTAVDEALSGKSGKAAGISVGGSYAVTPSLLVDAQVTGGADRGGRGWGVSGRFVY